MVDQEGKPWVNEGNHRIAGAALAGVKYLPVEVRFFNGGEQENGVMSPANLTQYHKQAIGEGYTPENYTERNKQFAEAAFNREKQKPIWYLKSERLVDEKMRGPQPADDVRKMLIAGGVKPEEMKWTGIDDFLKGKTKVSQEEIKDYLANNNLKVTEVTRGCNSKGAAFGEDHEGEFDVVDQSGRVRYSGAREDAEVYLERRKAGREVMILAIVVTLFRAEKTTVSC